MIFLLINTIIFIIYTEISVGNILFRTDSSGKKSINIKSLLHFLIHPFYNSFLWNYQTLDINFAFIMILNIIFYYIFIV
jgi:hypothetical protein